MEIKKNRLSYQTYRINRKIKLLSGSNITLTPLIDVIFLLLIFFMIGSSLVFQPGITVNLPETKQEFKSVADKLIITLTKEKQLFFNDQRLKDWIHLEQRLAAVTYDQEHTQRLNVASQNRGPRNPIIILKADKDVSYNDVVKAMSISRRYGLNIFLVTKTERS